MYACFICFVDVQCFCTRMVKTALSSLISKTWVWVFSLCKTTKNASRPKSKIMTRNNSQYFPLYNNKCDSNLEILENICPVLFTIYIKQLVLPAAIERRANFFWSNYRKTVFRNYEFPVRNFEKRSQNYS